MSFFLTQELDEKNSSKGRDTLTIPRRKIIFSIFLFACFLWSYAGNSTSMAKTQRVDKITTPFSLSLTFGYHLFDEEGVSAGYQGSFLLFYQVNERLSIGWLSSYSHHEEGDFIDASFGLRCLIDDLEILPFVELTLGVYTALLENEIFFTFGVHASFGLEYPIFPYFRLGSTFNLDLPFDNKHFPTSKSFHLRMSLVF